MAVWRSGGSPFEVRGLGVPGRPVAPGDDRAAQRAAVRRDAGGSGAAARIRRGARRNLELDRGGRDAGLRHGFFASCERLFDARTFGVGIVGDDGRLSMAVIRMTAMRAAEIGADKADAIVARTLAAFPAAAGRHPDRAGDPQGRPGRDPRPRERSRPARSLLRSRRRADRPRHLGRHRAAAVAGSRHRVADDVPPRFAAALVTTRRHALLQVVRRPGGDRDTECAAVQRDAGGTRTPDRDGRGVAGHQRLDGRCATGIRRILDSCERLFGTQSSAFAWRATASSTALAYRGKFADMIKADTRGRWPARSPNA